MEQDSNVLTDKDFKSQLLQSLREDGEVQEVVANVFRRGTIDGHTLGLTSRQQSEVDRAIDRRLSSYRPKPGTEI